MKKVKGIILLCVCIICIILLTACEYGSNTENGEKIYDYIEEGNVKNVKISGNAKSIIIKQSVNYNFEFYNADLNTAHKYEVSCDENGDTLNISVIMENSEADNNTLGSFVVYVPQKEFDIIEVLGGFKQIRYEPVSSDLLIHANKSSVVLNLVVDQLDHNVTLNGSEPNAFQSVSVYLDKLPENITMDFNTIQNGTINDPHGLLKNNKLELDSGKPIISINNTKRIDFYIDETL